MDTHQEREAAERLAAARARHAEGAELLARGDGAGAARTAQAGLAEIGDRYVPRGEDVADDTDLKLLLAEGQIAAGNVNDGARGLLRILADRSELFARRHALG